MNTHQKHLLIIVSVILLIFALPPAAYSQAGGVGTGPGGVGSTDGTSSLQMWLKGDAGVYTDTGCSTAASNSNPVACWADQSGRGNSPIQANSGSRPVFATGQLNGNPVLQFNGTSHYLDKSYTLDLNSASFTLYVVAHTNGGTYYRSPYTSRCGTTDATRGGYNLYANGSNVWEFWVWWPDGSQWSIATGSGYSTSTWHILAGRYDRPGLSQVLAIDGPDAGSQIVTNRVNNGCPTRIGAAGTEGSPGLYFPGEIAEVIFYNVLLNTAQRTLIDNYLSLD